MAVGCKRCGNCCVTAEITLDPTLTPEEAFFALKRTGGSMIWRDNLGNLKLLIGRCPHLSKDGFSCLIYNERPGVCREYPKTPGVAVPGCRYYDEVE